MFKYLLFSLLFISTAHANDRVEISCDKYVAMTGDQIPCDVMPTIKVTKAQLEQAELKSQKEVCIKKWESEYGHCKQYNHTDYLTDKAPKECYKNSRPNCDLKTSEPKKSTQKVKLW